MRCLEEETILNFVEGRLHDAELGRVEKHAHECPSCDELLAAAFSLPAPDAGLVAGPVDGKPVESAARIGRYTVFGLIGVGGMSEVYAAYDPALDRKIALKLLRPRRSARAGDDDNRLVREAQVIASLSHPNVLKVHDVGQSGARVFIAMEYVDGATLSAWLAESPRSWREILAVFLDAARGLSAVHAAGLVHRDFKLQNVMIGRDGLVRVMDFGLARRIEDTREREIVGTPGYMAPEQARGDIPEARSDQYSFCVALHAAFYGRHPSFEETLPTGRPLSGEAESVAQAPANTDVPGYLWRAISRGLSARPIDRWASMDALVAALARDPARGRRRWRLISLGAVAATIAIVAGINVASRHRAQLCRGGPARLADAWSIPSRPEAQSSRPATVRSAFLATGAPDAADIWARVSTLLDDYAGQWLVSQREVCEASLVRREQPLDVLGLRMECLETRHAALEVLTRLFLRADRTTLARAVTAIRDLPPLDACADVNRLRTAAGPPMTPELERRATDLRHRVLSARAMSLLGDEQRAVQLVEALVAEARAIGRPALLAETLLSFGDMLPSPNQLLGLQEAGKLALQAKRDDIAAEAYTLLAGLTADGPPRLAESTIWSELAEALQNRAGLGRGKLRAWLLNDRAIVRARSGDWEEARRLLDQALALKQELLAPDDPDIARTLVSQAENLHRMGRDEEAVAVIARACQVLGTAYGARSPFLAICSSNRGEYLLALGRAVEAIPFFEEALLALKDLPTDYYALQAYPLIGLGRARLALGHPGQAREPLERAVQITKAAQPRAPLAAQAQFALAQALWSTGEKRRAEHLAGNARDAYRSAPSSAPEAHNVETWLSARRGPLRR